jgi:predicted amidohydrolase
MRVAGIQLEAKVADVATNLEMCERLGDEAGADGAEAIVFPEFFSTGIGFVPELLDAALPPDGAATELLTGLARRHGALVGGSFLCRDADGEIRNAWIVAGRDGEVLGRHDKDLPTMWENAFYVGGRPDDNGIIETGEDGPVVGTAMCWEMMRTQTVRRLAGEVDLVMSGSGWWSIPESWGVPPLMRRLEKRNEAVARASAETFAAFIGAPTVHAAHAGTLECTAPWWPLPYDGHFQGNTLVADADGRILAYRHWSEGEGVVTADVEPGRKPPRRQPPDRFWLHRRGLVPAFIWNYENRFAKRWYDQHARGQESTPPRSEIFASEKPLF